MKIRALFIALLSAIFCISVASADTTFWILSPGGIKPLNQNYGISVSSSSTISALSVTRGTTTNATSTTLNVSGTASTSNLVVSNSVALYGGAPQATANALCIFLTGSSALCDGADATGAGGGGGSNWYYDGIRLTPTTTTAGIVVNGSSTISQFNFTNATGTTLTFGTTPWTLGFLSADNSFSLASSSVLGSNYFLHTLSTTTILSSSISSYLTDLDRDTGVRMNFGGSDYNNSPSLDQFNFHGRVKNDDWYNLGCPYAVGLTQVTSDTDTAAGINSMCRGFMFQEDATAYIDDVAGSGYYYSQIGSITANDGAGLFVTAPATSWLTFSSTTPSFEITARIGTIVSNSSTTSYYIGYTNEDATGSTFETPPTRGCYFVASTTANWRAICQSAGAISNTDTGISSTTITTGVGAWRTFRIDADDDEARFYIKLPSGGFQLVANPTGSSVPTTTALHTGIHFGRTTGTAAIQFQFMGVDFWWRKFVPNI